MFEIRLFSEVEAHYNERALQFRDVKVRALFAYLVLHVNQPISREQLAHLFWGSDNIKLSRTNLRTALKRLRQSLAPVFVDHPEDEVLQATRSSIQLCLSSQQHWVDVLEFSQCMERSAAYPQREWWCRSQCVPFLERMVDLYRGNFLSELNVLEHEPWQEWLLPLQFRYSSQVQLALEALTNRALMIDDYERTLSVSEQHLLIEPCAESAYRHRMRAYALSGSPEKALAVYEECVQVLREQLDVEPSEETMLLYQKIRSNKSLSEPKVAGALHLPAEHTPFMGRKQHLRELKSLLLDPELRWITIVGPGGIGKTRLSLRCAHDLAHVFLHGARFVSLAEIEPHLQGRDHLDDLLATAVAQSLPFSFHEQTSLKAQLWNYLQDKEMLLVMDNFEHLLEAAEFLKELLEHAPQINLVVTSRQPLEYQSEYLFHLEGLDTSEQTQTAHGNTILQLCEAVQLFEERVQRVQKTFHMDASIHPTIRQICQALEGHPLGIEIAAYWVTRRKPQEVLDILEQDAASLAITWQDLPPRHRNLDALFEGTWQLLPEQERDELSMLSVFRGEFSEEAAAAVLSGSTDSLPTFVQQCLLQRTSTGRYWMHVLLRQFFSHKLEANPELQERARRLHGQHYLHWIMSITPQLYTEARKENLEHMNQELDNLRQAWQWAVEGCELSLLPFACYSFRELYDQFRWIREGAQRFRFALESLEKREGEIPPEALYPSLVHLAAAQMRMMYYRNQWAEGIELLKVATQRAESINDPMLVLEGRSASGILHVFHNPNTAEPFLLETLALAQEQQVFTHLGLALISLALLYLVQGRLEEAKVRSEQALSMVEMAGLRALEAVIARFLSRIECYHAVSQAQNNTPEPDDLSVALSMAERSVEAAESMGHVWIQGFACHQLGIVFLSMDERKKAKTAFQQAISLRSQFDRTSQLMESKVGLAYMSLLEGYKDICMDLMDEVIEFFQHQDIYGVEDPAFLFLSGWKCLSACEDPRTKTWLQQAQIWLAKQLQRYDATELSQTSLNSIPTYQELSNCLSTELSLG